MNKAKIEWPIDKLISYSMTWLLVVMCEPQVFGLRADSSLAFFEISGFGRVRVV